MYALIDANNFFVSCERLFRPDLEGKPVVVLSSNDGCAISRSNEAKALGVTMGAPRHTFRDIPDGDTVVSFSANFSLYATLSERMTAYIAAVTPHLEIYSIDESFLDLSNLDIADYTQWGRALRARILRDIGIPVSIGIAPTKTLCKIAADYAKKHPSVSGAFCLSPYTSETRAQRGHERVASGGAEATLKRNNESTSREACPSSEKTVFQSILQQTQVHDIWGIGWRLTPKLRAAGIHTAYDVASLHPRYAGQLMGVHGRQLQAELSGIRCLPIQKNTKPQQMISRGRQFGTDTRDLDTIRAAVTSLTSRASKELRRESQQASYAAVILRTNRNKPNYRHTILEVRFEAPTADTGLIISRLVTSLEATIAGQPVYHKAEVILGMLTPAKHLQYDVFGQVNPEASETRYKTVDAITAKYGSNILRQASELLSDAWRPRREHLSPRYTTEWSDLPVARTKPDVAKNI